jgi:hypothetical protein
MTLKHDGKKWPRMTEMLSEADNPSFGLMPWVGRCAVDYIREHCIKMNATGTTTRPIEPYVVNEEDLDEAKTHYKTISKEALDIGSEVHSLIEEFLNEQTS